jgi:shikimate kinase
VADPEAVLKSLLTEREAIYAEADITVTSLDVPHEAVVEALVKALAQNLSEEDAKTTAPMVARP